MIFEFYDAHISGEGKQASASQVFSVIESGPNPA